MRRVAAFFLLSALALTAGPPSPYRPYMSPLEVREHVDGSPLLIDGRVEFYLFPGVRRERMPDRYVSCTTRLFTTAFKLGLEILASALRRPR